jgi:hypothetical protein
MGETFCQLRSPAIAPAPTGNSLLKAKQIRQKLASIDRPFDCKLIDGELRR